MGEQAVLTGMVLNAMPIGEYDKRITVLTKERGKITAFARGARRPTSQLLAATNPFSFGEFEFFQGRSTYNLAKATISNYFRGLSADPEAACYGFYFLEAAGVYAQENNDGLELLGLLYQTLRALENTALDNRLIRRVFELRILLAEGEYPNLFSCQSCGNKESLQWFSVKRQGMLCAGCPREEDAVRIDASTLYTMQYVLTAKLEKLYTFQVSEAVQKAFEQVMDSFFVMQAPCTFRSLEILKAIAG